MPISARVAVVSWFFLSILAINAWAAKPHSAAAPATKHEAYSVIQVGTEVRVIRKADLKNEEKTQKDRYQKDLKAYQDSKKSTTKAKDGASAAVKPDKAAYTVKVLKSSCKNKDEADDFAAKYKEGKTAKADASKGASKDSSNW